MHVTTVFGYIWPLRNILEYYLKRTHCQNHHEAQTASAGSAIDYFVLKPYLQHPKIGSLGELEIPCDSPPKTAGIQKKVFRTPNNSPKCTTISSSEHLENPENTLRSLIRDGFRPTPPR